MHSSTTQPSSELDLAGERVVVPFFWRDPRACTSPIRERIARMVYDKVEDDEDESFIAEMLEKSPSELFVDLVIWPLFGLAIAAILMLVISGALWGAVELLALTHVILT